MRKCRVVLIVKKDTTAACDKRTESYGQPVWEVGKLFGVELRSTQLSGPARLTTRRLDRLCYLRYLTLRSKILLLTFLRGERG